MSEVQNTSPITDFEVKHEADRLLRFAAEKNGITVAEIPAEVVKQAHDEARKLLERTAADESNPYRRMYLAEREQHETTKSTLTAIREQSQKHSGFVAGPPLTAAQAAAKAGPLEWNHRLTPEQKIKALGVEPSQYSAKDAAKIFARGADPKLATDLHKADPSRYKILREVAIATGSYAK